MCDLTAPEFTDEEIARTKVEEGRWPNGPVCPHCGGTERNYSIAADAAKKIRVGLYKCGDCDGQFTVTVGTVFEGSKVPLSKWLLAIHLMCASKKGMSSINFFCNLAETATPLPHFWEHTIGSDHAPVALRADWQRQLERCHNELGFQYVRFHGLLSDDMGTLVREKNKLLYSFFNADQVFDFLLSIGMKPFVELSFMPEALASGNKTVFNYEANVTPPRDYKQWAALINRLVSHWVQRYGVAEVREWFFEVWNEPNLKAFWTGTQRDYFRLYRNTAEAIKEVDASLRVGGPATAKSEWIEEFVDFCFQQREGQWVVQKKLGGLVMETSP